jgi:hypothetical protein
MVPEGKRNVVPRTLREKDLEHHLQGRGKGGAEKPEPAKPRLRRREPAEDPPLDRALELLKTWQILIK